MTMVFGVAGVATAETAAPSPAAPQGVDRPDGQVCQRVHNILERIKAVNERLKQAAHKLAELRAKAEAAGKTALVQKIDQFMARVRAIHDHLVQLVEKIRDRVGNRCPDQPLVLDPVT